MENRKGPGCRSGLQPGMIVQDVFKTLKEVTRIEGDHVYWRWLEAGGDRSSPEMVSDYAEFADRHFLAPKAKRRREAA